MLRISRSIGHRHRSAIIAVISAPTIYWIAIVAAHIGILLLSTIIASASPSRHDDSSVVTSVGDRSVTMDSQKSNASLYRLPRNVMPTHYNVLLLTNGITQGHFVYSGTIEITLHVIKSTDFIILHQDQLEIIAGSALLIRTDQFYNQTAQNSKSIPMIAETYNPETHFYKFKFQDKLEESGNYTFRCDFIGEIRDDIFGFYRSSYLEKGKRWWLAATQFSSIFARRAFPCMDEPSFKATFQLIMGHYENETVTTNTPALSSKKMCNPYNYVRTTFGKTPLMSTYLLGWAVHDFTRILSPINPRFAIWSRPSIPPFSSEGLLLLEEAPKIYAALESALPFDNPVFRIDQFAVPDFHFNAMENWGFITYRETVALLNEATSPTHLVYEALDTIGHEYAHTWFGNLVTMDFWDCNWLKEGFATYYSSLAVSTVYPEMNVFDIFVVNSMQSALLAESEEQNHTLNGQNMGSPASITAGVVGFVPYHKGASIIRMLNRVLGDEAFNKGINSYLQANIYGVTNSTTLSKHLTQAACASYPSDWPELPDVIDSWTTQPGYPLLSVSQIDETHYVISQELFRLNRTSDRPANSQRWLVPLSYATRTELANNEFRSNSSTRFIWLKPAEPKLVVQVHKELTKTNENDEWTLFNVDGIGYYRVKYDSRNLAALIKQLDSVNYRTIPAASRAMLLDDAFNLARAGLQDYAVPLGLARYLKRETDYAPWLAAIASIGFLNNVLRDTGATAQAFMKYARELMLDIYSSLGFERKIVPDKNEFESRERRMLRNLIVSTMCSLDYNDCLDKTKSIFDTWIRNSSVVFDPDISSCVYREGVRQGNDDDWLGLWKRFEATESQVEKTLMITALGKTENETFINNYLNYAIGPETNVPKQLRHSIFAAVIHGNSKNIRTVLGFLQENSARIIKVRNEKFLNNVIELFGNQIVTELELEQLNKYITENKQLGTGIADIGEKAAEEARENIAWINEYGPKIAVNLIK